MANYRRINKATARKMYRYGFDILLLPCKVSEVALHTDGNAWVKPSTINIKGCNHEYNKFDRTVNEYEYFNCNADLGYYSHFFVSERDLEYYTVNSNV